MGSFKKYWCLTPLEIHIQLTLSGAQVEVFRRSLGDSNTRLTLKTTDVWSVLEQMIFASIEQVLNSPPPHFSQLSALDILLKLYEPNSSTAI